MPIMLPDPDEIIHVPTGTIIKWRCKKCQFPGTIENGFGIRYMNRPKVIAGIEAPKWRIQSYCYHCRMAYWDIHRADPAQPYLIDPNGDHDEVITPDDDLPEDPTSYFEGIQ